MMQSSLIGKVEKAKRYATERNRVSFSAFTASFEGEHDRYSVRYEDGRWRCSCTSFSQAGLCSHVMAMQRMLDGMVPAAEPVALA